MTQILHDVLNKYTYRRVSKYTFRFFSYVYKNIIYLQTRACGVDIENRFALTCWNFCDKNQQFYIYMYMLRNDNCLLLLVSAIKPRRTNFSVVPQFSQLYFSIFLPVFPLSIVLRLCSVITSVSSVTFFSHQLTNNIYFSKNINIKHKRSSSKNLVTS